MNVLPEEHIFERLKKQNVTYVDVGHKKYTFVYATKVVGDGGAACWGYTDFENNIIKLKISMPHDMARETLVHEIWHALFETVGLAGSEEDDSLPKLTNESLVVTTTRAYMLFVNLNPDLVRIISTA